MTSTALTLDVQTALEQLRAAVDVLLVADVGAPDSDGLLHALREMEAQQRRLAAADARVVGELDARGVAHEKGARDTASLLRLTLRVDPGEARARVLAARDLSSRTTLSGQRLEPALPLTATAMRAGQIGRAHAAVIAKCIDSLPVDVQAERDREIEAQLVAEACRFAPYQLKTIATRINYHYDQDGRLATDADRARRRSLTYRRQADGTVTGEFLLDPVTGEAFQTVLDSLLVNASAEQRGDRSPAQLRHDALRDLLLMHLRTGQLPATGGVTTTMVVTMSLAQWATLHIVGKLSLGSPEPSDPSGSGQGLRGGPPIGEADPLGRDQAFGSDDKFRLKDQVGSGPPRPPTELAVTQHGALLPCEQLVPLLGDAQAMPVVLSGLGPIRSIEAYGTKHRIFSENQRLALAARDRGCTFPGCTSSPPWCEAHHIVDHAEGGPTSVGNGTLLCVYHHRSFTDLGYTCMMIEGVPHWIAPPWIDPTQTPQRNTAHDPVCTQ